MRTGLFVILACAVIAADEKPRSVPLDSIYGTTGQKEIKRLSTATDGAGKYIDPAGAELAEIIKTEKKSERFFLVNGKDIEAALKASVAGFAKDPAVTGKENAWLAVYFGTNGSSPPAWQVESVAIDGKTIRLSYKKSVAFTDDVHHYYAFVPLGKLDAGEYAVELYDAGAKKATATGKTKVAEK